MVTTKEKVLEYIKRYFEEHCYAPSYEEIMNGVGLKSKSSIYGYLEQLFAEGELVNDFEDDFAKPRAFRPKDYICISKKEFEEKCLRNCG